MLEIFYLVRKSFARKECSETHDVMKPDFRNLHADDESVTCKGMSNTPLK